MIPDNIILTYRDNKIPSYIISNIKKLNPEKDVLFFSDEDVVNFLKKEYDQSYVDFFHTLEKGCTKGDFFRYCYLLKRGGYYCDIDIEHKMPISSYVIKNLNFFSVISAIGPMIFQALLYAEKDNEIIYECIKDIMKPETARHDFYYTTEDMYKNVSNVVNKKELRMGQYQIENMNIQLAQEVSLGNKYACVCQGKLIAMSRYENYTRGMGFLTK